jgi:hypothetical protein
MVHIFDIVPFSQHCCPSLVDFLLAFLLGRAHIDRDSVHHKGLEVVVIRGKLLERTFIPVLIE